MAQDIEGWSINFARLLSTGQLSDFEIECEGKIFKVHKAILNCASPFFRAAIENLMRESIENRVKFPEDEVELIARILIFIYTGIYESEDIKAGKAGAIAQFEDIHDDYAQVIETWELDAELAVKMYNLGRKLGLTVFTTAMGDSFAKSLHNERHLDTVDDEDDSEGLDDHLAQKFAHLYRLIYTTTLVSDWSIRNAVIRSTIGYIRGFKALNHEIFVGMLQDLPELTLDVATSRLVGSKCRHCEHNLNVLMWRCKCGRSTQCVNDECNKLRTERTRCIWCWRYGAGDMELLNFHLMNHLVENS